MPVTSPRPDAATYHYPPELFELLVECVPKLIKGKQGIINFFHGCGVPRKMTADFVRRVQVDRDGVRKHELVRSVLERLNEAGDARDALRARREVVRQVTEWDAFASGYPEDRLQAENLVGRIRRLVNVKDTFTKIADREAAAADQRLEEARVRAEAVRLKKQALDGVRRDLYALFPETDAVARGKKLEDVLNRYFQVSDILVEGQFTLVKAGEGIIEQIDGVVRLRGGPCLVEMKWLKDKVGPDQSAQHLVRVHHRPQGRGILISGSGFTAATEEMHRDALARGSIVVLCGLDELVRLLDDEGDLRAFLEAKMDAASIHKNPHHRPLDD